MTEGYIKFNCNWDQNEVRIPAHLFQSLEQQRSRLYDLKLIGMYPDGIGFGNISVKSGDKKSFFITGSATGQFSTLAPSHYALVNGFSFEKNSVSCTGQTKASAESLTHAAVYEAIPEVCAVVHVHSLWLWKELLNISPTTSSDIEYGTPDMAMAVKQLAVRLNNNEERIIVMGGHREGILAFGKNLEEATQTIITIYNRYKND